jgi:hypothetical protein
MRVEPSMPVTRVVTTGGAVRARGRLAHPHHHVGGIVVGRTGVLPRRRLPRRRRAPSPVHLRRRVVADGVPRATASSWSPRLGRLDRRLSACAAPATPTVARAPATLASRRRRRRGGRRPRRRTRPRRRGRCHPGVVGPACSAAVPSPSSSPSGTASVGRLVPDDERPRRRSPALRHPSDVGRLVSSAGRRVRRCRSRRRSRLRSPRGAEAGAGARFATSGARRRGAGARSRLRARHRSAVGRDRRDGRLREDSAAAGDSSGGAGPAAESG